MTIISIILILALLIALPQLLLILLILGGVVLASGSVALLIGHSGPLLIFSIWMILIIGAALVSTSVDIE